MSDTSLFCPYCIATLRQTSKLTRQVIHVVTENIAVQETVVYRTSAAARTRGSYPRKGSMHPFFRVPAAKIGVIPQSNSDDAPLQKSCLEMVTGAKWCQVANPLRLGSVQL